MSQTTVLNPTLYRRLLSRFGEIKVRNQGQARVVTVRRDLEDKLQTHVKQWGEQYVCQCPFCRAEKLAVSYMYGQLDASGEPMIHLATCFGNNCLRHSHHRLVLADTLNALDGLLENARVGKGKVLTDEERIPDLPTPRTRLDQLKKGHSARRWLKSQGFDPDKLARQYDLSVCEESADPLTDNRIIIPVTMREKYQGWEALKVAWSARPRDALSCPKYLSAKGMATGTLLYNLDRARDYETPVIVQEPMAVWAVGLMALCPLGAWITPRQVAVLEAVFRNRQLVLLVREADRERLSTFSTRTSLERAFSNNLLVVEAPADIPPGAKGRADLRELVKVKARDRGWSVRFTRKK
jgi:hypothetical protein